MVNEILIFDRLCGEPFGPVARYPIRIAATSIRKGGGTVSLLRLWPYSVLGASQKRQRSTRRSSSQRVGRNLDLRAQPTFGATEHVSLSPLLGAPTLCW